MKLKIYLGKEKASTQRGQARALRGFRAGARNALVCTCVAEEGLDVGRVDLILCFDVSTRSPVRLVQRYVLRLQCHKFTKCSNIPFPTFILCVREVERRTSSCYHTKEIKFF